MTELRLPHIPNNVYESKEAALLAPTHPFRLVECTSYKYFYNDLFDDLLYIDSLYQNSQAHSTRFQQHLLEVAQRILELVGRDCSILEIGCGKGYFIDLLKRLGCTKVHGYDSTYDGSDTSIKPRYFTEQDQGMSADVILLRHTLEHIPNPVDFLKRIIDINGRQDTLIFIEVPCFDWILRNQAFWDLTIEHCNYFNAESFRALFRRPVIDCMFDQQYLLVSSSASELNLCTLDSATKSIICEHDLTGFFPSLFNGALSLDLFGHGELKNCIRYWIWGAATKGVMFLWHMTRTSSISALPIGFIDINPEKDSKYIGCLGSQIHSPQYLRDYGRDGDLILVVNPAYLEEVSEIVEEMKINFRLAVL
jgi:hypothetical protein